MASASTTAGLRAAHAAGWALVTRDHAFLVDVNQGAISEARFNTWLAQDYKYVRCFARLLGRMISHCPEADLAPLVGGMAAIDAEMCWFVAKAKERGIDLDATATHATCEEYTQWLATLHGAPYAVQAAAFWAMEAIYNQAWTRVGEGLKAPQFAEFVHRWGNAGFAQYVTTLAAQADAALAAAPPAARAAAADAVARAVQLEAAFWNMAYGAA